ncbi:MAG TPA: glycine zipper 2TM domain-containing protein [Burkholderiaceae bacterium]|jgi:outer membrane lipoprotein SlyB
MKPSPNQYFSRLIAVAPALVLLTACSSLQQKDAAFQSFPSSSGVDTSAYGRVESIQVAKVPGSDDIGVGSVVGGLIGGLIANQLGGGNGKLLATAAGAGLGGFAGHEFEVKNRPHEVYRIRVQLDSGDYRTVSQDNDNDLAIGNRVHVDNGHVFRY